MAFATKTTPEMKIKMSEMYWLEGKNAREIAAHFKVSQSTVQQVVSKNVLTKEQK